MRALLLSALIAFGMLHSATAPARAQDCGIEQSFVLSLEGFSPSHIKQIETYLSSFTCAGKVTLKEASAASAVYEYSSGSDATRLYRSLRLMLEHMGVQGGIELAADGASFRIFGSAAGPAGPPPAASATPAPKAGASGDSKRNVLIVIDDEPRETTARASRLAARVRAATAEALRSARFDVYDPPGLDSGTRVKQPSPQVVAAAAKIPGGSRVLLVRILPVFLPAPASEPMRLKLGISWSVHENGERRVLLAEFVELTITRECVQQQACLMEEAGNVGTQLVKDKAAALIEKLKQTR